MAAEVHQLATARAGRLGERLAGMLRTFIEGEVAPLAAAEGLDLPEVLRAVAGGLGDLADEFEDDPAGTA